MGILEHHAQRSPQIRLLDLVDIDTVVTDLAVCDIIEAVDQVGDRRLSCSCCADKGNLLSRFRIQADIVKHDLILVITEVYVVKDNCAFLFCIGYSSFCLVGMFPCPDIRPDR